MSQATPPTPPTGTPPASTTPSPTTPSPSSPKQPGKKEPPKVAPQDNRYKSELKEMQETAVWGVNIAKVLKAKTGGEKDYTKEIELSIRREFFSWWQYLWGIWWGGIFGLFIGMIVITAVTPNLSFDLGDQGAQLWGYILLMASIVYFLTIGKAHSGITKCVGKDYKNKIEPKFWGAQCRYDADCTASKKIPWRMCVNSTGTIRRFMHGPFRFIFLLLGIGAFIVTSTGAAYAPQGVHVAQAIIYGIFGGTVMTFLFSNG